jgi:hypothetical protein
MIAFDNEDENARSTQSEHLISKKKAGTEVNPIAVEDIAGKDNKRHALFDGKVHEGNQCLA